MKRDYSNEPIAVRADKKFSVENANACGFSLRPARANRGGFPVLVSCDGRPAFRVDSPAAMPQAEDFSKLEIDTGPGGGVQGDAWCVELYSTHHDIPRPQSVTDAHGALLTRSPGAKVLFSFDYATDLPTLRNGFWKPDNGDIRYVYVDPTNPKSLVVKVQDGDEEGEASYRRRNFGKGFDLSGFRQVVFGVEMTTHIMNGHYPFAATALQAHVSAVGPNGGGLIDQRVLSNALNGASFGDGVDMASIMVLGGGYGEARANAVNSYLPPFAHFYFYVEGAPSLELLDGEFEFRFWAVGY